MGFKFSYLPSFKGKDRVTVFQKHSQGLQKPNLKVVNVIYLFAKEFDKSIVNSKFCTKFYRSRSKMATASVQIPTRYCNVLRKHSKCVLGSRIGAYSIVRYNIANLIERKYKNVFLQYFEYILRPKEANNIYPQKVLSPTK